MTREEFEYAIKSCGCFIYRGHIYYEESELIKAFEDMGLIKQELCEDAISQQGDDRWLLHFGQNMAIPSAEPREVLYSGDGYADGYMVYDMAECPNCGYEYEDGDKDWGLSFCPNCGQKLNWESEDKE